MSNLQKALDLAELGFKVFPCRVSPDPKNPRKMRKIPLTPDGFKSGTDNPLVIEGWDWSSDETVVGVWAGGSGIVVLDIDVKRDNENNIVADGYESISDAWLLPPETFEYQTAGGEGVHKVYTDPGTAQIGPNSDYRGMTAVDRRGGGSFVAWVGPVPENRSQLAEAPEWLLDPHTPRDLAQFEGDSRAWFEQLEPGEPSVVVKAAIARAEKKFADKGNDFTHSDLVEMQYEAVRLGAEGHSGVETLLDRIKELTLAREGEHSRNPDDYESEFVEALASGIAKHGAAIDLRKNLPAYNPALIPATIPDHLVSGIPGDKPEFNALLRALTQADVDPMTSTSILWNCPKTKEIARSWGLQFVYQRVTEAQTTLPPERENPTLDRVAVSLEGTQLLTPDEIAVVKAHPTFIDEYCAASYASRNFSRPEFAIPAAWSMLSMAFGFRAFIPKGTGLPVNLWMITLGYSSTGKSVEHKFLTKCLDLLLKQPEETYYNLGAGSSPEALHLALLERDRLPSIVNHDEASDFFENLKRKDWMSGLKDNLAKWYDGYVPPVQKISLKELKGKDALTSFNMQMYATPDRLLQHIDASMFESGFLARVNWGWGPKRDSNDKTKYQATRVELNEDGTPPQAYDIVTAILFARKAHKSDRVAVEWTDEAGEILVDAYDRMDQIAKTRDRYNMTEPSVIRLGAETIWKCAALLALYRGDRVISRIDALTAVYYAQTWFDNLFLVAEAAGQGEFAHNLEQIEAYIRKYPKGVSETKVYDRFKDMARFSRKDVDNVIEYLMVSGRILRDAKGPSGAKYVINGGPSETPA